MTSNPGVLRLAPHSVEAEEAVIGGVLTDPELFLSIAAYLKPEDFHINRLSLVWKAMVNLFERKEGIDILTVSEEIRAMGKSDQYDDKVRGYLVNLINRTPTSIHTEAYARVVERLAVRRRLLTAADEIKTLAYDEQLSIEQIVTSSQKRVMTVATALTRSEDKAFYDGVLEVVEKIEKRMENPTNVIGVPTGLVDYDALLMGLQRGLLYIIAGRPGMGKTALLLHILLAAAKLGARVALFSQEMTREQVIIRLLSMETGINSAKIRTGNLDQREYALFVEAYPRIAALPINVTDAKRTTPTTILTQSLAWQSESGLDLVLVDYLQLLSDGGLFKADNETGRVSYFAEELKQISRDLDAPVVSAAQLNRSLESRADKRPMLSDLKQSGSIEQAADVVTFLYRDVVYNEETEFPNKAELIVAKHRDGATGTVDVNFERGLTRFSDRKTVVIDLSGL